VYKNLSIAVLLVAFGLVAARSTGTPAPTSTPTIVKKVILANQTAPIPTTTIFTPASNGLFRVSVYMTQVVPMQYNDAGTWLYNLNWTDDAGPESGSAMPIIQMYSAQVPPQAYGTFDGSQGNVIILEGVAGKPVTFSISLSGDTGGTYSAYFTVERLI
jgi:hypothetical protein